MFKQAIWLCAILLTALPPAPCGWAQDKGKPTSEKPKDEAKPGKPDPKDEVSETHHTVTINGKEWKYTATAGTILQKEEDGKPKASFFFAAYTLDGVPELNRRPVTFSFNGGPGSSSVWLHLGVLGPRRVHLNDDGTSSSPPYRLDNNDDSLLDETDLVFIDPVSTGYSRPAPGEDPKQFHGVQEDVRSVGEFIRIYTTRYKRWSSPKFLIGESYGTTRAAGLSGYLQDRYGMYLNGIMLVSSVLDFETLSFSPGNDLPYVLFLPTYTAAAWYHQKLSPDLEKDLRQTLQQAEDFALGEYNLALAKGASLSDPERQQVINKIAQFTGLSTNYIDRTKLRIKISRFTKELLRDQQRTVGRYDSRYTGIDRDAAGESAEYDPSYAAVVGAFTATMNDYVRNQLKYESDLPYEILTGKVMPWNYNDYQNRYLDVAETLRQAMTQNPHLKVFVANGYYDLATPFLATRYTFDHLGLDPILQKNVSMGYYEAGHMMYLNKPSRVQLKKDLATFIGSATPH
ncbi:MAG: S10 family peptidase [Limisphaerales bacterium]